MASVLDLDTRLFHSCVCYIIVGTKNVKDILINCFMEMTQHPLIYHLKCTTGIEFTKGFGKDHAKNPVVISSDD